MLVIIMFGFLSSEYNPKFTTIVPPPLFDDFTPFSGIKFTLHLLHDGAQHQISIDL